MNKNAFFMNSLLKTVKQIILNALENNDRTLNKISVYAFTNENIAAYLRDVKGDIALSICSSGDQYLNLISHGFTVIDLVDINPLTEYYALGIKKALILGFSYDHYFKILSFLFKNRKYDVVEEKVLFYLLDFMEEKYSLFWKEVFTYYLSLQQIYQRNVTLFQILTQDYYFDLDEIVFYNAYMQDQEKFLEVKRNVCQTKIRFSLANLLSYQGDKQYHLILGSNILEHTYLPNCDIKGLKDIFSSLIHQLDDKGVLFASYIYHLYQNEHVKNYPIGGFDISAREIRKEEVLVIPSFGKHNKDGILVLRK